MINASSVFRRKLNNDERDYLEQISMTLKDGTELSLINADIWGGSLSFDDSVSSDSSFSALGSCIVNSLKFTLNNIYDDFSEYDFLDAAATVKIGLDIEGTPEMLKKGVFTVVDPTYNGSTISLVLHDNMAKFDRPYSDSTLVYPASLDTIVRNLCTVCGVNLATSSLNFPRKDFVISERPSDEATTCREVLSWCATIAGCFARCNADGELELKWFNTDSFGTAAETLDGGRFDNHDPNVYVTGDTADGGTFNPWSTGDAYDGGSFDYTSIHIINSLYSQNIAVDDVVITQIQAEVKVKADTGDAVVTYSEGQPGYAIKISGNEFINETNAQNIVSYLGNQIIGTTFRKANVSHASDPTIEAGDCAFVYDRKGNRYNILITRTNFTVGSAQTTVCGADTPARNSATRYSEQTKSYVELRKQIVQVYNPYAKAMSDLASAVSSASGMYKTEVQQPGGGVITYWHNLPNLNESDIQIMISDVGYTFTNNGTDSEPTWYGFTMDGQILASVLNVVGINADWINTGQLVIKDANNNETFFADTTTGIVRINASSFTLKSSGSGTPQTIQQIADSSASEIVSNDRNLLKESDILYTSRSYAAGISVDYEGDGWWHVYGTYNSTSNSALYFYGLSDSGVIVSQEGTYTISFENDGVLTSGTGNNAAIRLQLRVKLTSDAEIVNRYYTSADSPSQIDVYQINTVKLHFNAAVVNGQTIDGRVRVKLQKGTHATAWNHAQEDIDAVKSYAESLETQIDGKAETWYQTSDPSAAWTTTALKSQHEGDLWYNSTASVQKYYRWTGTAWNEIRSNPPTAVFDEMDGKAQVFTSTPTVPYAVGDLWFNSATSDIMTCVTARSTGSYTASDWAKRNKYTDDSSLTAFINGSYATFVTKTNTALNSKITTYYQTSAPLSPNVGDLWVDTDNSNVLYRYNGSTWDSVRDAGIQSAITAASNAQTTADGKIITFAQSSQPTAADVGDLWIDTDDDNKLYRWNGSQWQSIRDSGIQSAITTANNAQTTASAAQTAASNAQTAATDAAKVATNYLDYNDTDGLSVGYRQSTERAVIKGDGMEVYDDNNDQIAQFKAVTRLGKTSGANLRLDYHSLQLQDIDGNTYVHLSDLRDNTGYATISEEFTGNGTQSSFFVKYKFNNGDVVAVTINGTNTTNYTTSGTQRLVSLGTAPSSGAIINITYKVSSVVRAFTFGSRANNYNIGNNSFVNGEECQAEGIGSHAEGYKCKAIGNYSHASGNECVAKGESSYANGYQCETNGSCSEAIGYQCKANYTRTVAIGYKCESNNGYSYTLGMNCIARYSGGVAIGNGCISSANDQIVIGKNNVESIASEEVCFIVGYGVYSDTRKNILTLKKNGNMTIAGTLTQSSDKRLKHHRAYLSDQEQDVNEFVNQLKPVWFEKDGQKHLGFYAQDVQQSDKWNCMVDMDTNGYLTLGYTEIIAPLVAYCQNQQKKIESLEERIARLEQLLNNQ